ncbi:PAS domain-containing protein [Tropicimonas sp. S265A]|uniref:PAS domain-containing protein n=1 Tax=Tropicimonas sp. S265A TaxID=3415134 RepID=UPI003C7C96FE
MNGMDRNGANRDEAIVSLDKRKATLRSKVMVDMLDYWQGLRPDGGLPARGDIDPRRIEGALPYAFVLERLAPGVARLRVAGGHLTDLMGMEVRGMPLSALFQHPDRNKLMGLMDKMFTTPRALELELSARADRDRQVVHAEMMILPLLDDQGMVTRALGCLVGRGAFPNPPYRFHIDAARETDIEINRDNVSFAPARLPSPKVSRTEGLSGTGAAKPVGFADVAKTYAQPVGQPALTGADTETAQTRPSGKAPFLRIVK